MGENIFIGIFEGICGMLRAADLMPGFSSAGGIFMIIAWVATALGGFLCIGSLIGADADADVDVDADGDIGFFSLRSIVGFLLGVGWGGYCGLQMGCGTMGAVFIGLGVGVVMFFIVAGMMRLIYGMRVDGTLKYETLVGMEGTVYITVPPHGEPGGQVQIAHPSQLLTIAAVQEGECPLPAQTRVVVTKAATSLVTVRPL